MIFETVSEFIDGYKRALAVKTDDELAERIGVAKSTIATWRRRESIPARVQSEAYNDIGIVYLPDGLEIESYTPKPVRKLIESAYFVALLRLGQNLKTDEEIIDFAEWLSQNTHRVRALCFHSLTFAEFTGSDPVPFKRMLADVLTGKHCSPDEIRRLRQQPDAFGYDREDDGSSPGSSPPATTDP